MTSLSIAKFKTLLPFSSTTSATYRDNKSKGIFENLDPEVGFQLTLETDVKKKNNNDQYGNATANGPELIVKIIGARHLPTIFGLKMVEGYVIKVKLFPGTARYDTAIQTASWPTFNEEFRFSLQSQTKSSIKTKVKHMTTSTSSSSFLPENIFKGHFVVLTVFALLELPAGAKGTIKQKLEKLRRKSSFLLHEKPTDKSNGEKSKEPDPKDIMQLTTSETRRNIGSVTCFLDAKLFEENLNKRNFVTEELWLPIKDITVTPPTPTSSIANAVNYCTKGQVEVILQLCDEEPAQTDDQSEPKTPTAVNNSKNYSIQKSTSLNWPMSSSTSITNGGSRWSFNDVKNKFTTSFNRRNKFKGQCLKITLSKMRCSIKVKEDFENFGESIYVKLSVFEHDILSNSWKSDNFPPTLSTRWNANESTLIIPLPDENSFNNISIKISVATKTNLGKKIFLGTLMLGPNQQDQKLNHWENMIANRGNPICMWHAFE